MLAAALLPARAAPAAAAEKAAAAGLARTAAPYLDDRTVLVAHVDAGRLDADTLVDALVAVTGVEAREAAGLRQGLAAAVEEFRKAGGKDFYVVYSLADLLEGPFVIVPGGDGLDVPALGKLFGELLPPGGAARLDGAAFVGPGAALARLRKSRPAPVPDPAAAFEAARNPPD